MKNVFLILYLSLSALWQLRAYSANSSLNVLVPMGILEPRLIEQFEKANSCVVRVEFATNHIGYESHLRSEIRVFDVVIANEESLVKLTTSNLLRSLPENLRQPSDNQTPLRVKTLFNSEVNTYVPLFVDPIGIAYNQTFSNIPKNPTWNLLIEPEKNPYWRQHIFLTKSNITQIAIALMASTETPTNSKRLPASAQTFLLKLRNQKALIDEPLVLAFLGYHVNAGVVFYSDYLRYKNIIPHLGFVIPENGTYFDRIGISICLSSLEPKLAEKFVAFMTQNSDKFSKFNRLFDVSDSDQTASQTKNIPQINKKTNFSLWTLYDESAILPFLPAQG